jgi:predicted PhzF superfamily epimerase YddE/YHI9
VAERAGVTALDIVQGEDMRRPSRLRAAMEDDRVRVGGNAVVVLEGTLHLDT